MENYDQPEGTKRMYHVGIQCEVSRDLIIYYRCAFQPPTCQWMFPE